jgi:hypothetical protein
MRILGLGFRVQEAARMADSPERRWDGLPVLLLIAAAAALAWVFPDPFQGFLLVFAIGFALLAIVEYARKRRKSNASSPAGDNRTDL